MTSTEDPRQRRFVLNNGSGEIPALGFGTLVSDRTETRNATKTAVEDGFRHLDCAERYRNEDEVGAALKELFADGTVRREDLFVTTKLWNNNHRPERVKPALQASPEQTRARRGRPVSGAHPVRVQARRRPGSPRPARSRRLRRWGHVGGNLGSDGNPCRRRTLPSDRPVRHRRRRHPQDRRLRPDQAGGRRGRVASLSPAMGSARVSAVRRASSCWRSRRSGTRWNRDCSTIRSSSTSRSASARVRRKCFWRGVSNAAPQS